jgi:hypothetical protein
MKHFRFYHACIGWPEDAYIPGGLREMTDESETIERGEFIEQVNLSDLVKLEEELGYDDYLEMRNDWHVRYFRSRLHGKPVIGFVHSAIEFVFTETE